MRLQRCFAVKSGVNGLLDVSRRVYCEIVDDVEDMVAAMAEDTGKMNYLLCEQRKTDSGAVVYSQVCCSVIGLVEIQPKQRNSAPCRTPAEGGFQCAEGLSRADLRQEGDRDDEGEGPTQGIP